jgi:preprotein translocase subunit SecF
MRLRLVPKNLALNFFGRSKMWMSISAVLVLASILSAFVIGMNFGIDFKGGTTIRTQSAQPVDVGAYRSAIDTLGLGDVSIAEIFDPTFDEDQNVAMIRI